MAATCIQIREPEARAQDSLGKRKQKNHCHIGGVLFGVLGTFGVGPVTVYVPLTLYHMIRVIWAHGTVSLVATQAPVLLGCFGGHLLGHLGCGDAKSIPGKQ